MEMLNIDGYTKQLGIIGNPVEHSFSPRMHNFISEITGNNYVYSAWCVEDVENAINGVRALGIRGINVTAPHKIEVMKYLDEIDEKAKILGSVNTVVNTNGHLKGYNTDAEGFYMSLVKAGVEVKGKKILAIGAGGVVQPTLMRLALEAPKSITLVNRTQSKTEPIKRLIAERTGYEISTSLTDTDFDIVINTTSAGMAPQLDALPTDAIPELGGLDFIKPGAAVTDMIYNPEETLFLREAKKRGAITINGLGMLIYQGIIAYELFTGTKLADDMYDKIKKEIFKGD